MTNQFKLTDIRTYTEAQTNSKGQKRALTIVYIAPVGIKLILINDAYAQLKGYKDRETLIKCMNWAPVYITMELYINTVTGKVQTFQDTIPDYLN